MKKTVKAGILGGALFAAASAVFAGQQFNLFAERKGKRGSHPILPSGTPAADDERQKMLEHLNTYPRETLRVTSGEGFCLEGYLYRVKPSNDRVIIAFHGYHSSAQRGMGWFAPMYEESGCDFLLINERSHETSEGRYITFGVREREDGLLWVSKILEIYGKDVKIFLHGVSMGAATVMMMAAHPELPENVKGIAEDCGYDNMEREYAFLMRKYPALAVRYGTFLMNAAGKCLSGAALYEADVEREVKKAKIPALMIHGTEDKMVPFEALCRLADAYAGPHEIFFVPGAAHAKAHAKAKEEYEKRFVRFVQKTFETGENRVLSERQ